MPLRTIASRMKALDASVFARIHRGCSRYAESFGGARFCMALAAALLAVVLVTLLVGSRSAT